MTVHTRLIILIVTSLSVGQFFLEHYQDAPTERCDIESHSVQARTTLVRPWTVRGRGLEDAAAMPLRDEDDRGSSLYSEGSAAK